MILNFIGFVVVMIGLLLAAPGILLNWTGIPLIKEVGEIVAMPGALIMLLGYTIASSRR